jgi:hypothetical protein
VTVLFDLHREVPLGFSKAFTVLLHLDLLLTHITLHSNNLLLHSAVVLVDLLHSVSFNSELLNFLPHLIVLLLDDFRVLHGLMKIS